MLTESAQDELMNDEDSSKVVHDTNATIEDPSMTISTQQNLTRDYTIKEAQPRNVNKAGKHPMTSSNEFHYMDTEFRDKQGQYS